MADNRSYAVSESVRCRLERPYSPDQSEFELGGCFNAELTDCQEGYMGGVQVAQHAVLVGDVTKHSLLHQEWIYRRHLQVKPQLF